VFGPVAVVVGGGVGLGEEGAVSAVGRLDESDVGVGGDLIARLGDEADEGVVERVDDEGGDGDTVEDAGGGGAEIVIVGAGEAGVEGGDAVVEVAQGADADGEVGIVDVGEERDFAAEAAEESTEEFPLVEAIDGLVQGVGGGAEVDGGRDADDGVELWRRVCAEVAGKLEDEVASHGVADERDGLELVARDEEAQDGEHVCGEAGVVEGGGEIFGAAAVAHIHADDVAAGVPELVGVADDVLRAGGAFEAVDDDGCRARGADNGGLPVAVAEDLAGHLVVGGRGDFDELGFGRREVVFAGEIVAEDGLEMAVGEEAAGLEVGFEDVLLEDGGHHCGPAPWAAWTLTASERKAVALRAPVGSSSCLK
jgi:hypothetical protein